MEAFGQFNFYIITSLITGTSAVFFYFTPDPGQRDPSEEIDDEELKLLQEFNSLPPTQQIMEVARTAARP